MSKNVFGEELKICSMKPITGFYRDGCCNIGEDDHGVHTVCVVMTDDFLVFSKSVGNDLSTPVPQFNFQGLKPGDKWCLCATRWVEAYHADKAPLIILEATHEGMLDYVDLHDLVKFAWKSQQV
jgi:uncharacterized protein (DUF2237 family)